MGREWGSDKGGRDAWVAWLSNVMSEALRVLKPGGHALVWTLQRTSHWTATALEDAGFEVRDVVTHLFGTGFPKSLNGSKALDAAAGAQRLTIGPGKYADRGRRSDNQVFGAGTPSHLEVETLPATDAAREWEG
ncbi:Adenine-specific methyltransferase [Myxococcus hansupus]|uniref:Adenine-specific methyltransferase n=1 Tax=Pseudomyxococcus hansupus TaxID=1297742 RepID=A0A0H4WNT5_9BACT|nr:Adenine-specific methyltransferase [Myxococcus hansupus]AKQ65131.1 Adenine-specific methyltransferase [Myxococcus hansupus]